MFLGLFLETIIQKTMPGQNPVLIFCGFILYYFSVDFVLRYFIQDLPLLSIQPYIILNIRRRQLIHFLHIRSLINYFNLQTLVLSIPFILGAVRYRYGWLAAVGFLCTVLALILINHFGILYLKRKTEINNRWFFVFVGIMLILASADYFQWFSVNRLSVQIFSTLLSHPWYCLVAIILAALVITLHYGFLKDRLYIEEKEGNHKKRQTVQYSWLDRYGIHGELLELDIKLIWRNKRPKAALLYSLLILFYGFWFYKPSTLQDPNHWWSLIMAGIFITGVSIFNYGMFLFAWQCSFYDGLMSTHLPLQSYLKSKWLLLAAMSFLIFLLTAFYGLMDWKLLIIQLACFLYNLGVNQILLLYFATLNYKAIDIGQRNSMNYQGTGIVQWLYSIVLILLPLLIYILVSKWMSPWAGIAVLGAVGLLSLLLRDMWLSLILKAFQKHKYLILQGFREK